MSDKKSEFFSCFRWFSKNDKNMPYFPENFEVAKYDVLEKVRTSVLCSHEILEINLFA